MKNPQKEIYEYPSFQIIEVMVESGFAESGSMENPGIAPEWDW